MPTLEEKINTLIKEYVEDLHIIEQAYTKATEAKNEQGIYIFASVISTFNQIIKDLRGLLNN